MHNTVDNPIFPTSGRRFTVSFDLAGLGGNTSFYKPRVEAIQYFQQTRKLSAGVRAQFEFVAPWRDSLFVPIFERLVQGGEYSVRGYDIRTIGPRDNITGLVIGGNKSLLFNGEYVYQIAGPVRVLAFFDAGQVRQTGQEFRVGRLRRLDGRRGPVLHAGAQRALPPDLRPQHQLRRHPGQQLPAGEEVALPLRRRLDLLVSWTGCIG